MTGAVYLIQTVYFEMYHINKYLLPTDKGIDEVKTFHWYVFVHFHVPVVC